VFGSIFFAFLSPVLWGLMNVWDKYVVEHRVKNPLSYSLVDGLIMFIAASAAILLLDWRGVTLEGMLIPAGIGIFYGIETTAYYFILKKEDVSGIIGFIYIYPIFVALLSFLFLSEMIPLVGYAGMLLMITGAVVLSSRFKSLKSPAFMGYIIGMVLAVAVSEFLIKVSTTQIPEINALAINFFCLGATIFTIALFSKKMREGFGYELKHNFHLAVVSDFLWISAIGTLFLAMDGLPATIVSSIAIIQPLLVLGFESMVDRFVGKINRDKNFTLKLAGIVLIVIGMALLYSTGLLIG
jgi:drug/metabolite transporter (DMT)-like permease